MKPKFLLVAAVSLAACSTAPEAPEAPDVEAVRDFIAVAGFERTDQIRMSRHLSYGYVNDYFASASEGDRHYLIEFRSRCLNMRQTAPSVSTIDHRRGSSYIRASLDTLRGCPIERIYSISQAELDEALAMQ